MSPDDTRSSLQPMLGLYDILELEHFQPTLPTDLTGEAERRRFGTLLAKRADTICPQEALRSPTGGTVLRKVITPDGEVFALKILDMGLVKNDACGGVEDDAAAASLRRAWERAFLEEYRCHLAVSQLHGFPELHGIGIIGGNPAMLMEWVEGPTLGQAAHQFGGNAETIARLGIDILEVLMATRVLNKPFVHRDLSPRNVIIGDRGITLVDFGSSSFDKPGSLTFTMHFDVWRSGTAEYAAPEMLTRDIPGIERRRTSPTIDTYALCSVLYELLCGRTPFMLCLRPSSSAYRVKMDELPERVDLGERAANELEELLLDGMAAEQDGRYSVEGMLCALRGWLDRYRGCE